MFGDNAMTGVWPLREPQWPEKKKRAKSNKQAINNRWWLALPRTAKEYL